MTVGSVESEPEGGKLVANLMHFARVLRRAGLPIGPGRVLAAVDAVRAVGITSREDFYWTLHAVFVNRREHRQIFDQAFHIFWRNPKLLERMMSLMLPTVRVPEGEGHEDMPSRRLVEALSADAPGRGDAEDEAREPEIVADAALTYSDREILQKMDFEQMTSEEMRTAKAVMARIRLPIMKTPTRRFRADPTGRRIDMRATLRASLRGGGQDIDLRHRSRRERHPPIVVLCDISGSMSRYSRMLLHFLHALTNDRDRVHTFLFGTRLTNITRHLRQRDVDVALDRVANAVEDWSGGTRIGASLGDFNRHWSRRVLGQGAVLLFISDGLDRDAGEGLAEEMERLHKSCRRLIWLNPLLRYEGFEPKSLGMRAILPHVDDFRTVHNLESLTQLAEALGEAGARREEGVSRWLGGRA
ncbi:MAG TPA: VWA domain-containing protein [Alphaproteobacteria bacterium]|nr:VWA domain-containing protein [Alphaproteobacteria bacterium]